MANGSIQSSIRNESGIKEMQLKEKNVQVEGSEEIILEKDKQVAFLERPISVKKPPTLESRNHALLQKIHNLEFTSREETREHMVSGLTERSEAQNSSGFTLPLAKCHEERLALMNQIPTLHQEANNSSSFDCCNSNGIWFPSYSVYEVRNAVSDVQRKNWARKKSSGETFTPVGTAKITQDNFLRELGICKHISEETMDDILVSPLESMSKDELISHHVRVVAEMRREKEILLAEKTEEIYRLKMKFLREKGNNDREVAALKRRLIAVTKNLDELVKDNGKLCVSQRFENENCEIVSKWKYELQAEKRSLPESIAEKERDLKTPADKFGETTIKDIEHAAREAQLLKQVAELESEREDIGIKNGFDMDILRTLLEETIKEKTIALNLALNERWELKKQMLFLEDTMQDKDRVLNLALREKEDQKQQIALMGKQIEEMENEHKKLNDSFHLALKEGDGLKKQNDWLENSIRDKNIALDSLTLKQEELIKRVVLMEETIKENEHVCNVILRNLEEARKEKLMLERNIQDEKNVFDCLMEEEENKRKQLEAKVAERENALLLAGVDVENHKNEIILLEESLKQKEFSLEWACRVKEKEEQQKYLLEAQVQKLKDFIKNMQEGREMEQVQYKKEVSMCIANIMDASFKFELAVLEKIHHNFSRLEGAKRQLIMLCGQTNAFRLRGLYYKELYERKCCNLQKAEEEVDLLGDEVDTLLSLLGKVYMVLDHYAPILQHYPGILDLVKLIKREIMGHLDLELKL